MNSSLLGIVVARVFLAVSPSQDATARPIVTVEFFVEDGHRQPVSDLTREEVVVQQDNTIQRVRDFEAGPEGGHYRLSYEPPSGARGAVSMRLLRRGAQARGPDGPALKIRFVAPLEPFEVPLADALAAPTPPTSLKVRSLVLSFEPSAKGRHQTLALEVPLRGVGTQMVAGACAARLGFLARVRSTDGREIERSSLDYPIEPSGTDCRALEAQAVIWTSHFHLKPGSYELEIVARDALGGKAGVERRRLEVATDAPGLQMSSVVVLGAGQSLSAEVSTPDNPLDYEGQRFVPAQRPAFVEGSPARLYFFVILYPALNQTAPELTLEIHNESLLIGGGRIALPAPRQDGTIPYVGFIELQKRRLGSYELRLVARQGEGQVTGSAPFDIVAPPRVGEALP